MEAIDVSPEMLTLVGSGAVGEHRWPSCPVAFELSFGEAQSSLVFHENPTVEQRRFGIPRSELRSRRMAA